MKIKLEDYKKLKPAPCVKGWLHGLSVCGNDETKEFNVTELHTEQENTNKGSSDTLDYMFWAIENNPKIKQETRYEIALNLANACIKRNGYAKAKHTNAALMLIQNFRNDDYTVRDIVNKKYGSLLYYLATHRLAEDVIENTFDYLSRFIKGSKKVVMFKYLENLRILKMLLDLY